MGKAPAHPSMMQDTECMIPDENIRKWFFTHEGPSAKKSVGWVEQSEPILQGMSLIGAILP